MLVIVVAPEMPQKWVSASQSATQSVFYVTLLRAFYLPFKGRKKTIYLMLALRKMVVIFFLYPHHQSIPRICFCKCFLQPSSLYVVAPQAFFLPLKEKKSSVLLRNRALSPSLLFSSFHNNADQRRYFIWYHHFVAFTIHISWNQEQNAEQNSVL